MKVRLTIVHKNGRESSHVYTMDRAFRLAHNAEISQTVKSLIIESEPDRRPC